VSSTNVQCRRFEEGSANKLDGDPYTITEFNFVKPGKGQIPLPV